MACGEFGPGRMAEPLAIVAAIERALGEPTAIPLPPGLGARHEGALAGRRVVVTSGPTYEPIDPVRFLGNRSSGRQGHAIAEAAFRAGADVTLISGPVGLADPPGVDGRPCRDGVSKCAPPPWPPCPPDVFVAAAAVADWRVGAIGAQKLKKGAAGAPKLSLIENPDILADVAAMKAGRPALVIGFAAETERVVENARDKLKRKGCDLIVANSVAESEGTFGGRDNQITIVSAAGVEPWPRMSKPEVARGLIDLIAGALKGRK